MHLPCDSEKSLEVASGERNEEQSSPIKQTSPIESPAKRPRNGEDDEDKSKFAKLLGWYFWNRYNASETCTCGQSKTRNTYHYTSLNM